MTAFEPALGLLSALTSLPAALYYARALGAAAVHPMRGPHGRIAGLRANAEWARTLVTFLGGTLLVATLAGTLSMAFGPIVSLHAALGAVLIAALWQHAHEGLVRVLLLLLLIGAGASRALPGIDGPAAVLAGYAMGLCCAWTARRYAVRRNRE